MDEAERCHRLAYIANGSLLTQGTVQEVIAGAHITTWAVEGLDLDRLAARLRGLPGVKQLVPFGNILHVSGSDAELLQQSLSPFIKNTDYRWTCRIPPHGYVPKLTFPFRPVKTRHLLHGASS